jgi:addiction module HigA family antidote
MIVILYRNTIYLEHINTMIEKRGSANDTDHDDIIHPGEIVKDELKARDMSQKVLANKINMSKSEISSLINGHRNINPTIAVLLENALGIEAEIWKDLQVKYDIDLVRRKARHAISVAKIPDEMKKKLKVHILAYCPYLLHSLIWGNNIFCIIIN